jgi:exopolyphosphatase/guanosine-5'-triphosphate,3'-diphosphate pyrophosphatase
LLHRYKNSRDGTRFDDLFELLDDRSKQQAEVLGKAMRLGAMLWMRDADGMAKLKWSPKKKILTLSLPKSALALFGEVAEARLSSLGTALGATEVLVKHTK